MGQSSLGLNDAGKKSNTAFGGRLAFNLCMVGTNKLHAGQAYENTSVTSTLPAGIDVGRAGWIKK
jgi:hypothetical protein